MSEVMQKSQSTEPSVTQHSAGEPERRKPLQPPANILEHKHGVTLVVEMPGVSREHLQLHCDGKSLVVDGEISIEMPADMDSLYADLHTTRYRREFSLAGEQLDTDAVSASVDNGILRIEIPKREELRPRKIEVTVG
jgi:HSP20 family molecular chaperone IbpA